MLRRFYFQVFLLGTLALPIQAQAVSDSLTPADTIGLLRRKMLFAVDEYQFHAATNLTISQLMPLFLRSSDSTVHRLALRAKRRTALPMVLIFGSYGLLLPAVRAINVWREPALAGGLIVGSMASVTTGFVVSMSVPGTLRRAVYQYNRSLRPANQYYTDPLAGLSTETFRLNEADTVSLDPLKRNRYTYRGIPVVPTLQLDKAMRSVKDPFITEGLRQNRVVGSVAELIGGFSAGFLSTYYLTRWIAQAAGLRTGPTNSLVYVALGGLGVSVTIASFNNRTTRQIVKRYNALLCGRE